MTATDPKACPNGDGRAGAAMAAIVGDDSPEEAALGGHAARVRHRRAGLVHDDAVRTAPKGLPVDRHRAASRGAVAPVRRRKPPERADGRAADPVAGGATVELDPLPPEAPGLAAERQAVAELGDDGAPSRRR
jgi:hypothetical protein